MKFKGVIWVGSSKDDFLKFPEEVRRCMGYGLYLAQTGTRSLHSKILKGFGGAKIIEIKENTESGTFRVVYTIKIADFIFVLHAFQKKSKHGIKTPKQEIDLVKKRFKDAQIIYKDLINE
ncbi:MAG: type II toxin-antitoxin system RelE/ParE family toxin [bacterium]